MTNRVSTRIGISGNVDPDQGCLSARLMGTVFGDEEYRTMGNDIKSLFFCF